MNITTIDKILHDPIPFNSEVTACGWVRTRRDSKSGVSFLTIYDGSCFESIQAVINNSIANYNDVLRLTTGCSVIITGKVIASIGHRQKLEIQTSSVKIVGWIEDPNTYPISSKRHSVEYLREVAHLRPRTNLIGAISRIRHTLAKALHRFFDEQGYFWISTPIITASNTEGTGEMFRISTIDMENIPRVSEGKVDYTKDFFGKESFLTVSGQLNGETYACALSKIYTFGPAFRAENSNTSRHLSEFWMLEPEVAFANLDDIVNLAEKMLKYVFKVVLEERINDMEFLVKHINSNIITHLEDFLDSDFVQVNYTDAIEILKKCSKKFKNSVHWGIDLTSEHERYLSERHFNAPIVIKNYPKNIKAFYMRLNEDGKTVAAMDVITPRIGEIIGGSQREERLDVLDSRMLEMKLNKEDYWWYRDLRRYGTVPHSGFGLGFERLVAYVTGVKNIRDVIPFPRTPHNIMF